MNASASLSPPLPALRIASPIADGEAVTRAHFGVLPLADCVLGLAMLANSVRSGSAAGDARLTTLREAVTAQRVNLALFDGPLAPGLIALDLAATLLDPADLGAFLAAIAALPDAAIVEFVVHSAGTLAPDAPRSVGVWQSLIADADWARAYLARFVSPAPEPDRALGMIARPAETRRALGDCLAALRSALAALLPDLIVVDTAAGARLERSFAFGPADFVAARVPPDAWRGVEGPIRFFPSAFLGAGTAVFAHRPASGVLIACGVEVEQESAATHDAIVPEIAEVGVYQDVYRLLADPARWAMVQLLVAAPRYGQELAELLDLSVATVSHHLGSLKRLDLVETVRAEHRLYYHLRTDRLRALLAGAERGLFAR